MSPRERRGRRALFSDPAAPAGAEEPPPPAPGRRAFFDPAGPARPARSPAQSKQPSPPAQSKQPSPPAQSKQPSPPAQSNQPSPPAQPDPAAPPPRTAPQPDPTTQTTSDRSHMSATVVIVCRSCRQETVVGLGSALRRLVPSVWLPFGRYNRLLRCPACHQVAWCRIDWTGSNPLR